MIEIGLGDHLIDHPLLDVFLGGNPVTLEK